MEFSDDQISRAIEENNASRIRDYISLGLDVDHVLCFLDDPNPMAFTLLALVRPETPFRVHCLLSLETIHFLNRLGVLFSKKDVGIFYSKY